jgi:asparagine synthase (glutamine-hydrolysing)
LQGKYLHRKAVAKWLPREFVYGKKLGFSNPFDKWLRGSMRPLIQDCLLSDTSAVNRYFDRTYLRELFEQHLNGRQHRRHINLLLSFELWHRQFIT